MAGLLAGLAGAILPSIVSLFAAPVASSAGNFVAKKIFPGGHQQQQQQQEEQYEDEGYGRRRRGGAILAIKKGLYKSHPYLTTGCGRRALIELNAHNRKNPYHTRHRIETSQGGYVSASPSSVGTGMKGGDVTTSVPLDDINHGPIP